jgi:Serine kinase of the HPr protein, regulates carbohydrate metabolism
MILSIADFHIRITSEYPVKLDEGYDLFVNDKEVQPDVEIVCYKGIPYELIDSKELLFEAKNQQQRFYSIYKLESGLGFAIYQPQKGHEIQQIALLDESFTHWEIYSEPDEEGELLPLKYPMGPIMMYYLTVNSDAVMIHASGIFDGAKGRIFTGFSGRGKSTISRIWAETGSRVVNDDRLIIRKCADGIYFYNTPMFYRDMPKRAPLHSVHLIRHSLKNEIERVSGAKAISKVLAFCIQNNYDKRFVQNHLRVMSEICMQTAIYETGFLPDKNIVHHILEHED